MVAGGNAANLMPVGHEPIFLPAPIGYFGRKIFLFIGFASFLLLFAAAAISIYLSYRKRKKPPYARFLEEVARVKMELDKGVEGKRAHELFFDITAALKGLMDAFMGEKISAMTDTEFLSYLLKKGEKEFGFSIDDAKELVRLSVESKYARGSASEGELKIALGLVEKMGRKFYVLQRAREREKKKASRKSSAASGRNLQAKSRVKIKGGDSKK